jgi:hypothetical protein
MISGFKNSRVLAPFIVVAIIVIGLSTLTSSWSSLTAFFGFDKPEYNSSTGGPVFGYPRLNGLTLDGCVLTTKSQLQADGDPDACNVPSQMEIAGQFCLAANYERATRFTTKDTLRFHDSYKLAQTLTADGDVKYVWNRDQRGGFIFTSITCEEPVKSLWRKVWSKAHQNSHASGFQA